ncbi:MAG: hypothetical protein RLZZ200_335, partial [Pseudomonadota bacterium]
LDTNSMQAIAGWTNLSETTFLLPATEASADYRLRIFTPRSELPFAGHPTLGSAHALLEAGLLQARDGKLVQQCGVGLVPVALDGEGPGRRLSFDLPRPVVTGLQAVDIAELEAALGHAVTAAVSPAIVDVGAVWLIAQLPSVDSLLGLRPGFALIDALSRRLGVTGVTLFARHVSGDADIEVRSFAPSIGVDEDPVCRSGNGSIAVFQRVRGLLASTAVGYTAAQGQRLGRAGRVYVRLDPQGRVTVGGACVTTVDGLLHG